jgi:hypothetical protein
LKRYKAALESKRLSCEEQLDSLKRQRQNPPPCSRDSPSLTLYEALKNIAELKQMVNGCQSPAVTSIINLHHNASTHRRSDDLLTYLSHSRTCRSSDRRDRVYAFIGLVGPSYGIVLDYSDHNTIIHVLIDTAQKIIHHDRNLRILSYAAGTGGTLSFKLPSWVPDWTRERSEAAEALSLALRAAAQTKTNRPTRRARPVIWTTTQYSDVPDAYRDTIHPIGHESTPRPRGLEGVDDRNHIPVEFIKGNGREDMLVLKVKGKRVGCLEILDSRAKPVAGKLAKYRVVKKTPGRLLGVEAIAPSSR